MEGNVTRLVPSFSAGISKRHSNLDSTISFPFEITSIVVSACFTVLAIERSYQLIHRPRIIRGRVLQVAKLICLLILTVLELQQLLLLVSSDASVRDLDLAARILPVVTVVSLFPLSNLSHSRSIRPSTSLTSYLAFSFLIDLFQTRNLWLSDAPSQSVILSGVTSIWIFVVLLAENVPKQRHRLKSAQADDDTQISPEETNGPLYRALFIWLNPLISLGSRKILSSDDLFPLDRRLSAKNTIRAFRDWNTTRRRSSHGFYLLARLLWTIKWPLLEPVPARLCLLGFSFGQPFFIGRLTRFMSLDDPPSKSSAIDLLGAAVLIYVGLAISSSMYWHAHYRMLTRIRASLSTLVFDKSVSAADLDGSVLTLMSTDIDRVCGGLFNVHETWAHIVQVSLATWLLHRELGNAAFAPVALVVACVALSSFAVRFAGPWQAKWSAKTQHRVKVISAVITQIKAIEAAGRTKQISTLLNNLRQEELDAGARFRLLGVFSTCVAFAPMLLAPLITFASTSSGAELQTSQAYAALAYLTLLSSPLAHLLQVVPLIVASTTSLRRLSDFTAKPNKIDRRIKKGLPASSSSGWAVRMSTVSLGWTSELSILNNVSMSFGPSQLSVITGPVGSGKSTLCKAVLGEVPFVSGDIDIADNSFETIAYCDQHPFLTQGSIRDNIIGTSLFDAPRYQTILQAVLLDVDIALLPNNDETHVNSTGSTLSGGQKQRIALARAVYMDAQIYVLDDPFNGIDHDTAELVKSRLLGPQGLLKDKTVIWATHTDAWTSTTHQVIALESGGTISTEIVTGMGERMSLGSPSPKEQTRKSQSLEQDNPKVVSTKTLLQLSSSKKDVLRNRHDLRIYSSYFKAVGVTLMLVTLCSGILFSFAYNFGPVWISFWISNSFHRPVNNIRLFYFGLYALFQFSGMLNLAIFTSVIEAVMTLRSGFYLHSRAVACLLHLPLGHFSSTSAGAITTLFSQDMGLVDTDVCFGIANTMLSGLTAMGQFVVVASATPIITIAYPFLLAVFFKLQAYYLKTSRQLRLLELEAKEPLYETYQNLVRGIVTIRALGWSQTYRASFRRQLDNALRTTYLFNLIGQWLSLILNLIIAAIAVTITYMGTQTDLASQAGLIGAGLVTLMTLGNLAVATVRCWTQLETSFGAVKRLEDFQDALPTEKLHQDIVPTSDWPERGHVRIDTVTAEYETDFGEHVALKDVSLDISPARKVAIVGRTGSGKSSLFLLLLRLLDPTSEATGRIFVDDLPLDCISRDTVRERIIAVPQDPVFLGDDESMKTLIDPDFQLSDDLCEQLIARVGLQSVVQGVGGIHAKMEPSSLSHGQRQLVGIVAALARKHVRDRQSDGGDERDARQTGGIVMLDEVTSSLDPVTEDSIVRLIFDEFCDYTIIWITHNTALLERFETVYRMAKGRLEKVSG